MLLSKELYNCMPMVSLSVAVFLFLTVLFHAGTVDADGFRGANRRLPIAESLTQEWTNMSDTGNYTARHECSFVQAGQKFYMFGGRESPRRLDVYDIETRAWNSDGITYPQAPVNWHHFQATNYEGLIFVVGAFYSNRPELNAEQVGVYDPANNVWMLGPAIPSARRRGAGGLVVHNDRFYMVDGNNDGHRNGGYVEFADEMDPNFGNFVRLPNAPRPRDHFHAAVCAGKLYAAGGRLSGGDGGVFAPLIPEVDVFDFDTEQWETLPALLNIPTPRAGTTTVCLDDRYLVILGGEGGGKAWDTVEAFDTALRHWVTLDPMNSARHGTQAILSGGSIYVAAGSPKQGGGRIHAMEVYGGDNAVGETSVAGTFDVVEISTMRVRLKHNGGNQGVYITDVNVTGDYELGADRHGRASRGPALLRIGGMKDFYVLRTGSGPGIMTVTHSGGQVVTVDLPTAERHSVVQIDAGSQTSDKLDWFSYTTSKKTIRSIVGQLPPFDTLHRVQQKGILSYTIPELTPNGYYILELGWLIPECVEGRLRFMKVYVNDRKPFNNWINVYEAGCGTPTMKRAAVFASGDGQLKIDIHPHRWNSEINSIELFEVS